MKKKHTEEKLTDFFQSLKSFRLSLNQDEDSAGKGCSDFTQIISNCNFVTEQLPYIPSFAP